MSTNTTVATTTPPAGAVAQAKKPAPSPQDLIKANIMKPAFVESLKMVLPKHMTGDRQARVLLAIITKNPKLVNCTWASLAQCMIDCSSMGLEPDGRRAHLIPYGNTCTLIVDYKGLVELIYRSGAVDFIDAYCVYRNELTHDEGLGRARFDVEYGGNPSIYHKPILDSADRGDFIGAYCVAHIKNITKPKFVWMTKGEIDAIRKRSKAANSGPWVSDYEEMAKKTTIRRISKTLPLSYEINELLMKEVEHEHGHVNVDEIVGGRFAALKPALPRALGPGETASAAALVSQVANNETPVDDGKGTGTVEGEKQPADGGDGSGAGGEGQTDEKAEADAGLAPTGGAAPAETVVAAPAGTATAAPAKNPAAGAVQPAGEDKIVLLETWCKENNVEERNLCAWAAGKFRISPVDSIREMADFAPRKVAQIIDNIATYTDEILKAGGAA